jgi:hypothetical protein
VDLTLLDLPGGPISSRRPHDRASRGWKKVELWIEQEDPEEIILDDDDDTQTYDNKNKAQVKIEDEDVMREFLKLDPKEMDLEDDEGMTDNTQNTERARAQRRKRAFTGKSKEEKEEIAREELDLEVMQEQFLTQDPFEVQFFPLNF